MAALGFLLVAGSIGFLLRDAMTSPASPPDFVATARPVLRSGDGWLVPVVVANHGASAAAQVIVRGELMQDGAAIESGEVRLDYVGPHSQREGGILFSRDPGAFGLRLRVVGYAKP